LYSKGERKKKQNGINLKDKMEAVGEKRDGKLIKEGI
jgi:hypothetical protein